MSIVAVASIIVAFLTNWYALAGGLILVVAMLAFFIGTGWIGQEKRHLHDSSEHEDPGEAQQHWHWR